MSEPTQRWLAPDGTAIVPVVSTPTATPSPPELLPVTLVSDHAPRPALSTPVVFPGYEIQSELGRGGMGVVYKARQRSLNRLVALKVILGGPLASAEDKARFRIEAEAAARLHHPNIVQVYDVGEYAGFSFIAFELIDGETLRQWQGGRAVEPKVAAKLVSAVARGIQHAHEQGIVHRDLKPANILLAHVPGGQTEFASAVSTSLPTPLESALTNRLSSGSHAVPLTVSPKVTDFGLAKPLEGGNDLTVTGVACGTPNYMAPEQIRGKSLSPGVDVYGLGAVLFELLAGRPPFVGADAGEVMNLILRFEAPNVRKFSPGVPRDLAVIVAKCLEKDPARRYLTARDAADDLDRFLAGKPIKARPIGPIERTWRWVQRNPVPAVFLFISSVGCTITGSLAVALARSASDERAALARAVSAREEAEQQRRDAEAARDGLRNALTTAEDARQLAEKEQRTAALAKTAADNAREEAKQEAQRAVAKQQEADGARARAEANLRIARGVIRVSLRELSGHPRFEDEDFRQARLTLIVQVRTFRDAVSQHAPNTPEWLDDIADVSHWLGFLEFLNNNQTGAAAEYRTAAEAAERWGKLEPAKPEPRARQSNSLVNAGNALFNARRFADAEVCYRDAIKLIDGVTSEVPRHAFYRQWGIEAYGQLANVLRATNQPVEWEKVAKKELERARELVDSCGKTPDNLRHLATAHAEVGKALTRRQKWDEADKALCEAIATRERIRELAPQVPRFSFEYAAALLSRAALLSNRGQHDSAGDILVLAVATLEKGQAQAPYVNANCVDLAIGYTQFADHLRGRKQYEEAERRYNQALDQLAVVMKRSPGFRHARVPWANAMTGRAHLYNSTKRHREAAAEWAKLAAEDADVQHRPRHELFVMQSLLFAQDWKAATAVAETAMKKEQQGAMWLEIARIWCLAVKRIEADDTLTPADKLRETEQVVGKAVACLEKAKAAGEFPTPESGRWLATNPEFAPVRGKFDHNKK